MTFETEPDAQEAQPLPPDESPEPLAERWVPPLILNWDAERATQWAELNPDQIQQGRAEIPLVRILEALLTELQALRARVKALEEN